jgi:hypothetical protein
MLEGFVMEREFALISNAHEAKVPQSWTLASTEADQTGHVSRCIRI